MLIGAAGGGEEIESGARELEAMGASPQDVDRYRAQRRAAASARADGAGTADVWPDMAEAVEVFAAMATQWRSTLAVGVGAAVTVWHGLRYEALAEVRAMLGIAPSRRLLADLRTMEAAALPLLNARGRK